MKNRDKVVLRGAFFMVSFFFFLFYATLSTIKKAPPNSNSTGLKAQNMSLDISHNCNANIHKYRCFYISAAARTVFRSSAAVSRSL
jgi:hypothetical protein